MVSCGKRARNDSMTAPPIKVIRELERERERFWCDHWRAYKRDKAMIETIACAIDL